MGSYTKKFWPWRWVDTAAQPAEVDEVLTSAQLRSFISDETGIGAAVFAGGDIGAATATTPATSDNDTSVATTAFVKAQGYGDVSGPASSVDSEVALFSGTGGKTLKRAALTGIAKLAAGVLSAVTAPAGAIVGDTDTQTLSAKTLTAPVIADFTSAQHDHLDTDDGGTLSGSAIASGTVADARLSSNVALKNQDNAFSVGQSIAGNVGIGTTKSPTAGVLLLALSAGNEQTMGVVQNTDGSGTTAAAIQRVQADTAISSLIAHGIGRVISRWGQTLGGWTELLTPAGNGLAIGTNSTKPLIFGTSAQGRSFISGAPKTLTESSATGICDVGLADNTVIGGTLRYTVDATDATDYQARRGAVPFVAVSKAGAITTTLGTVVEDVAVSAGTLTAAPTITTGAAKITLNLNAVSSLVQTTLRASFTVVLDGGTGNVVAL